MSQIEREVKKVVTHRIIKCDATDSVGGAFVCCSNEWNVDEKGHNRLDAGWNQLTLVRSDAPNKYLDFCPVHADELNSRLARIVAP